MFKQLSFSLLIFTSILFPLKSNTQIIPDNTLGVESSEINSIDDLRTAIEGGAIRGDNLFHSFQQFSVNEGLSVDFANPEGIANIFSRVTGSNISEIFGTLGVAGAANLFLMNPNGIVFGENAAINVNGSFLATTAEGIDFNNGDRFSTDNPNKPQITIDFPIGLGFGSSPGDINIQGEQNNVTLEIPSFKVVTEDLPPGLEVKLGNNISLIGGSINFDGGGLLAPGGDIELHSIDSNETLELNPVDDWFVADSSSISSFKDIILSNAAYVDVSSERAGNINLNGRNISIDEGSVVLANTAQATNNTVNVNASELLEIKGSSGTNEINIFLNEKGTLLPKAFENDSNFYSISMVGADILPTFEGNNNGNDININAKDLKILDAGQIRTVSFSDFKNNQAGNINIDAENILVEGTNNIDGLIGSVINSSTGIGSKGDSGNVDISTSLLEVKNGGRIKADTFSSGAGGQLNIAAEQIFLEFRRNNSTVPAIFQTGLSTSPGDKDGSAGKINIKTESLYILKAEINNSSFSRGIPGDIRINTKQLKILDGGAIRAETSSGNSANIFIDAQSIELNGTRPNVGDFSGGISTSTRNRSSGDGGNININTNSLKILNGSIIRAISLNDGDAGNININAETIEISGFDRFAKNPFGSERVSKINTGSIRSNGGELTINSGSTEISNLGAIQATTRGRETGGNITLNTENLEMFGQGRITASALDDGNGGNITINSDTILGIENSDITANAVGGDGGKISIASEYILGIEERTQLTLMSDITASSDLGIDGTIEINSPVNFVDDDAIAAIRNINLASTNALINDSCINRYNRRKLGTIVNRGRGGIPESPDNYFDSANASEPRLAEQSTGIIEANTLVENSDGSIDLVAKANYRRDLSNLLCSK